METRICNIIVPVIDTVIIETQGDNNSEVTNDSKSTTTTDYTKSPILQLYVRKSIWGFYWNSRSLSSNYSVPISII